MNIKNRLLIKRGILFIFLYSIFSFLYSLLSPTIIKTLKDNELIPINIILKEQFDGEILDKMIDGLPKKMRQAEVVSILKTFSYERQVNLILYLKTKENYGKVSGIVQFWIGNIGLCKARKDVILDVERREDGWFVNNDLKYSLNLLPKPQKGILLIYITYAPEVWALGYPEKEIRKSLCNDLC